MKKALFLLSILCCFVILKPATAQDKPQNEISLPGGEFKELKRMGITAVEQVIDPQTVRLSDGSLLSLVGLYFPDFSPYEIGDISMTAKDILKDMVEGQSVFIYQTQKSDWGRVNRMGHDLAQVERQSDKVWIQGTLLSLGLAQVRTDKRNPEMAAQMYALENKAREQKIGIWADDSYKVLSPEETPDHLKSWQIVEGKVESVATKNNRTYINFGKDWRTDFTVSIKSGDKRDFSKRGINPLDWGGKHIRVRGWLDEYNGPYIQINHPEAVEVLSKN